MLVRMGKVVSLSKVRKDRARAQRRRQGDANAARFGQTLEERRAQAMERDKAKRDLNGKERE